MSIIRYIRVFVLSIAFFVVLSACNTALSAGSGPPASWTAVLGAAQKEAYKIDKDAILRYVHVDIVDNPPKSFDHNKPVELRFDFIRPNERAIEVTVRD